MFTFNKSILTAVAVLSLLVAPVSAGVLSLHPDAFNDGGNPVNLIDGAWTGDVSFDNGSGLAGTIDYAVFTAADFNANFGGLGYVPTKAFVYTYQVHNTGSDFISAEIVGVSNPAFNISSFDLSGVIPSGAQFNPNARWDFASPAIQTGQSSDGLVFESNNKPISGVSLTVNGGSSQLSLGLPTPGPISIPEPSSLALILGLSSLGFGLTARRRG